MSSSITTHPETYLNVYQSGDLTLSNPFFMHLPAMQNVNGTFTSIRIEATARESADLTKADHLAIRKLLLNEDLKS